MARRPKHIIRVDFTPTDTEHLNSSRHNERVRYLWMMVDQLQYPIIELLRSNRRSRRQKWLQEARIRYERLGLAIKHFNVEGE